MRRYSLDRFHIFKRELKNAESRLRDIGYLEKSGNSELLSIEKDIVSWTVEIIDKVDNVCARFYLYDMYVLKKIKLTEASAELGYRNPSAFIKMMRKSVQTALTDEAMDRYQCLLDREQQLLKESLSETR